MADTTIAYRFAQPNGILVAGGGMNGDLASTRIARTAHPATPATSGRTHRRAGRHTGSGAMLPGTGDVAGAGLMYHVTRRFR